MLDPCYAHCLQFTRFANETLRSKLELLDAVHQMKHDRKPHNFFLKGISCLIVSYSVSFPSYAASSSNPGFGNAKLTSLIPLLHDDLNVSGLQGELGTHAELEKKRCSTRLNNHHFLDRTRHYCHEDLTLHNTRLILLPSLPPPTSKLNS
ncbi:unnamed protein product [Lactuca saligna]|uniref:Uncharacterized protein n=1 Tax=Lactuca saligna TaxID=75948 RepID=A0AA35YHN7_LACSI|nr:unnamed protein product [Lactuca saligna]